MFGYVSRRTAGRPELEGIFIVAFFAAACAPQPRWYDGTQVTPTQLGQIKNLSAFGDRIYMAGQPSEADLRAAAARGVKTVINLRTEEEMKQLGFDEKAAAEKVGMSYLNVPVGREAPSEAQLQQIFSTLDRAQDTPVLLHCGSANRVGYVWSMFRATRHGLPTEAAIEEGKKAGLRTPELEERSRKYIEEKAKSR